MCCSGLYNPQERKIKMSELLLGFGEIRSDVASPGDQPLKCLNGLLNTQHSAALLEMLSPFLSALMDTHSLSSLFLPLFLSVCIC